ncbi:MAG: 1-(5-phosphoribosyl)-5-[(5-phosphoribosylamino)methylideneamino] imidazole-4-carboxamide isomerase [Candidatus Limnocylindrales bacterium]|nr:1-(5-phosphoribosyl)-5-[(5-phosphoribosylamino)methylideneamino] imidazole-4-carboxamide isomerase [Candidatus Limnocylindrales bacterium]
MSEASGFEILPAIDLRGGRVVRLRQGDFANETAYSDDPVEVAQRFADAGARWLHVVDLDAARSGRPTHGAVIAAIVAAIGDRPRVEVAGGLRDEPAVAAALASGAVRAIVGTAALREPAFAGRLVATHGADRIAAAIDVRDGRAIGHGWSPDAESVEAAEAIERLADVGVTTFEVTAIERDGLLEGPNLGLYERLVQLGLGSIIASGGITTLDDLRGVRAHGCTGAIVGRALYEGRLDLLEALALTGERS